MFEGEKQLKQSETNIENSKEVQEKARELRSVLTESLPREIIERSRSEDWDEEKLEKVKEYREKHGMQTVRGFHISDREIDKEYLQGGSYYASSLDKLYAGKSPKFLYVVEGASNDELVDKDLGWYKSKGGKIKILLKLEFTPELANCLDADFAECEYHHS